MKTLIGAMVFVLAISCHLEAQVPGDGIPDLYYFPSDGTANTSLGVISRPAGTLTVDTDGTDMIAVLISGPDVSQPPAQPGGVGCDLCDNGFLPCLNCPPFFTATWAVGFAARATQWIRTAPLSGLGYQGVIGDDPNPNGFFPEFGLANYGPGLGGSAFPPIFDDGTGQLFSAIMASDNGDVFYLNFVVPEPASGVTAMFALCILVARRRRRSKSAGACL